MVSKRQNKMNKKNKKKMSRTDQTGPIVGYASGMSRPVRGLSYTPSDPGCTRIRSTVELNGNSTSFAFTYTDFQNWAGNIRSILTPFAYFRVCDVRVSVLVGAGSSSPYTILFNISNGLDADTSPVAILNDDYSAIATSLVQPVLYPGRRYWKQGVTNWLFASDASGGTPTLAERSAGIINVAAQGATLPATVVGWLTVDMEIEFHTLV